MDRPTRLVFVVACLLLLAAGGIAATRYLLLGDDLVGMGQGTRWNIKIRFTCYANNQRAYLKLLLPQKSDAQQIASEEFKEEGVTRHLAFEGDEKAGEERNRILEWRNTGSQGSKEMQCRFVAQTIPGAQPSPPMPKKFRDATRQRSLAATERIQSSDPLIQRTAKEITGRLTTEDEKIEAIYAFCAYRIANEFVPGTCDALFSLTNSYADCGGKSRLLVALCRACGIPARLVGGLILNEGIKRDTHVWTEVWLNNQWVPFCPLNRYKRTMPADYLILYRGDRPVIRHRYIDQLAYDFELHRIAAQDSDATTSSNQWREIAVTTSLSRLSPNGQWIVKFLLLIPLGALIVCLLRNIVGIPTIGTFAPVLISLGIHLAPLRWGILTVVVFIGLGLLVRWIVERFKLILVPRLSVMLTIVISAMIVFVVITDKFETDMGAIVGLLPVVILTMSIERCWLLEIEDGFFNMIKHLAGSLISVVIICTVFRLRFLVNGLFVMPELILAIVALMLIIGRYSGFRLSEILRFRALAHEDVQP